MVTASQKHHYMANGLSRFAWVTVGQLQHGEDLHCDGSLPIYILNALQMPILAVEECVVEAARQGIHDAETESHWTGESHVLVSLQGLLADGIDADAARIAAKQATKNLIRNSLGG